MYINNLDRSRDVNNSSSVNIEIFIASIPLFASTIVIILNTYNSQISNGLIYILFISSIFILISQARRKLKRIGLASLSFILGFVFWYSLPGLIKSLQNGLIWGDELPIAISEETVIWSVFYLSIFLLSTIIFQHLFDKYKHKSIPNKFEIDPYKIILFAIIGCIVGLIPIFTSGLSINQIIFSILDSRASAKPWRYVDNLGNTTSAFLNIAQGFLISGSMLLWIVSQDKRVTRKMRYIVLVLAVFTTSIIYFNLGTRSITALVLLPMILYKIISKKSIPSVRTLFISLVIFASIYFLMQFQLYYRASYTRNNTSQLVLTDWATLGNTSDYFRENLFAVALVPSYHEYFNENIMLQFVTFFIPRFLWSGKPASIIVWYYTLMRWNVDIYAGKGGNVFPGIVGQFYMSWGLIGTILLGLIIGWLISFTDSILNQFNIDNNPYKFSIGAMLSVWVFLSYRILSPGLLYPIIFAYILIFISQNLKKRNNNPFQL